MLVHLSFHKSLKLLSLFFLFFFSSFHCSDWVSSSILSLSLVFFFSLFHLICSSVFFFFSLIIVYFHSVSPFPYFLFPWSFHCVYLFFLECSEHLSDCYFQPCIKILLVCLLVLDFIRFFHLEHTSLFFHFA